MHFDEDHATGGKPGASPPRSSAEGISTGVVLLVLYFVCDSFTSQYQTALYKQKPGMTVAEMMLGGNLVGLGFTVLAIAVRWESVGSSLLEIAANREILKKVFGLGVSGALGQFCIYNAIRVLGPLSFTWIMTARQLISVLLSLVYFGHGVSARKLLCITTVFGIMSWRQLAKTIPKRIQCCVRRKEEEMASPKLSPTSSEPDIDVLQDPLPPASGLSLNGFTAVQRQGAHTKALGSEIS